MKKKVIDIKQLKFYLILGVVYFLIGVVNTLSVYPVSLGTVMVNNFWGVIYLIPLNFILYENTVPYILKKRKNILYNILFGILLIGIFMIMYSYGSYCWRLLGIWLHIYTALKTFPTLNLRLQNLMVYSVGSVFIFGIVRHIYNYINLIQASQRMQIEKQAAELSYLKSQTNPHFLFNTLNNIYSLARDKSDLAPESILRLSKMLRFMLYETSGDYIAIEQELKIINDYIDLEKLRYDESLIVNFNYSIEDMKQALPPLLLIPLVENAFKHGVSETRNNPFVDIHLSVLQQKLKLVVKNSAETLSNGNIKENIGLSNLRRQLELLYTDYNLYVSQSTLDFTVILKINLASHV